MSKIKTTTWECVICQDPVSELGAYAKISLGKYAHTHCLVDKYYREGIETGRKEILNEQKAERKAQLEQEEQRKRVGFSSLGRCGRCGIKINTTTYEYPTEWGQVHAASSTQGVCAVCVRNEVQARARARQPQAPATPAEAVRQAPSAPVRAPQPERPKTEPCMQCKKNFCPVGVPLCDECQKSPETRRFELLDMD